MGLVYMRGTGQCAGLYQVLSEYGENRSVRRSSLRVCEGIRVRPSALASWELGLLQVTALLSSRLMNRQLCKTS